MRRPTPTVRSVLRSLARDRRGATALEYGLILALIVVAMMAAVGGLGTATTGLWTTVHDAVRRFG